MIKSFLTKTVISLVLSAVVGGGVYTYFTYTQKKIQTLTEEVTKYEINIRQLEATLATIQRDKERIERETAALQIRVSQAEDYQNDLLRKLQRHDLTRLTLAKPGLIETRVNNATKQVFEDLESLSRDN
jgi:type II secretory pathway component PulJ